ncbi:MULTISPECIES: alpha-E domain-containing protein [Roseovarius]|uniref:alpha-E domain-containing protein n=1 Tax=Roseovarius TaxID=74030 RepID=UPI001C954FF8|nr:alpha-E domain-containing protein [Roseovarius atlanticus]MBY5989550.1 alpha-E domain-containing protein [Roseovarius atlanticus]MBY6124942.1 alpha-E domain-containing protein [Roseovarius atlanticus]MBY6149437.1 alpha-E domain-containing protein [Roseovarius atlanticus]
MLGKTANGLFWLFRYLERAENTARLIETGQRIALTRLGDSAAEWRSVLQSAGVWPAFEAARGEVTKEAAINWLLRDRGNSSSVYSCICAARQNARLVRTALTGDMWEAINSAYMNAQENLSRQVAERDLPGCLRTLRQNTSLVRGMTHGTMLRGERYDFARLGTFLERADNTARILDVKYYVLLPTARAVGSALDNVQWETILRSVAARGGFRMEYGADSGPREITHFLILDQRLPRSLAFCAAQLQENLRSLNAGNAHPSEPMRKLDYLNRKYLAHEVEAIFDYGLHEYITEIIGLLAEIANEIEREYRFYE